MKSIVKIGLLLIICAVIGVTVVTATVNKDLPSQDEVTQFISEMNGSSASDIFGKVKEDHTTWNADLFSCGDKEAIALYYTYSNDRGYGSVYCNETGIVTPSSLKGYTLKESYKGELNESGNNTEENSSEPVEENDTTIVNESETSSTHTYESFKNALDKYDGKLDCTSENCAQSLSDYYRELGWSTEVKHCVAVTTSDEGTIYVVLGV